MQNLDKIRRVSGMDVAGLQRRTDQPAIVHGVGLAGL